MSFARMNQSSLFRAYPNNYKEPCCDENEMYATKADDAIPLWYGEET